MPLNDSRRLYLGSQILIKIVPSFVYSSRHIMDPLIVPLQSWPHQTHTHKKKL